MNEVSPRQTQTQIQDPRKHISATTPGVDDSPYLRFAIDQLTRDEEVAGVGRHGSVLSTRSDYPVERVVPDENLGYYHRSGPTTVEIGKPGSRQGHTTATNTGLSEKQGKAVFVAVEPGVHDPRNPPLDFVPVVLRPWALAIFSFLVLWMIAAVVFCNVWSQRHSGIWDWDGVGTRQYFITQYLPQLLAGLIGIWSFRLPSTASCHSVSWHPNDKKPACFKTSRFSHATTSFQTFRISDTGSHSLRLACWRYG